MNGRGSGSDPASAVPDISGISMSRNTTSGCVSAMPARASMASAASPTTIDVAGLGQQLPHPHARRRLVVHEEGAEHHRATPTRGAVCSTSGN